MKHSHTFSSVILGTALTLFSFQTFAGPGALVDSPLVVGSSAPPNIMFIIDSSGSMGAVVEESYTSVTDKYDNSVTYIADCGTSVTEIPDGTTISMKFTGSRPNVRYSATNYRVHYSTVGTADTTESTRCFNTTGSYPATLGDSDGNYSGNYLNWYFTYNNTSTSWTASTGSPNIKPGTQTRKVAAQDSLTDLVTSLEATDVNLRIGFAAFGTGAVAEIHNEIKYLDSTQRDSINTNVDGLASTSVGTPLAGVLHSIGRYFIGNAGTAGPAYGSLSSTDITVNTTNGQYTGNLTLHPDTTATTDTASSLFDRSPIYPGTDEGSPIQYWCQNNFSVMLTDGLPRKDDWTIDADLEDYDGDCVGASPACDTLDRKTTYTYDSSTSSDYLDDVAQALFEMDLRPDITDYNGDEAKLNLTSYIIAFADADALSNQLLTDAGDQGGGGGVINASDSATLVDEFSNITNKILATTSSAASVSFNTGTLTSNTALYQSLFTTSRWSGDILAYPVDPSDGAIDFDCTIGDTNCWSAASNLDALASADGRQIITFRSDLDLGADGVRGTTDDTATSNKGVPFVAPADFTSPTTSEISTTMLNDLCAGPDVPLVSTVACTSATTAAKTASQEYIGQMVDYIRGDTTYEDTSTTPIFRTRQSILGDIIHSSSAFIGTPSQNWSSAEATTNKFGITGNRYSDYKTAQAARTKVLYVAANDGMLHALRTENKTTTPAVGDAQGDEMFAYMPAFVFSDTAAEGYHYLATPTYKHKYYLDLSPTATDVYSKVKDTSRADFATAVEDWHTILIGGSRGGEKKGFFALDVTDPENFTEANAADKVLWEFTNSDDADLGYTYSQPTIALTNAIKDGHHRWAAVFGNGYQSDAAAVTNGSSCHAALFIVFLDGGLDGTWVEGTDPDTADYIKLDTLNGATTIGDCNGLSTPALQDTNSDRVLDRVYAGDVQGNMWVFDLSCGGGACGDGDFTFAHGTTASPEPLFTATDIDGTTPQPIMSRPAIAKNTAVVTKSTNEPNLMVLFATGQYHIQDDATGTSKINTVYGVWDAKSVGGGITNDRTTDSDLIEQTISTYLADGITPHLARDPVSLEEFPVRTSSSEVVDYAAKPKPDMGWYADLEPQDASNNLAEERVVVDLQIRSNIVFFNTAIPNARICGAGGEGWLMGFNFVDGAEPSDHVFDANHDGAIDDSDHALSGDVVTGVHINSIPTRSTFVGDYQYTQGSDKSIDKTKVDPGTGLREGRLSWRELRED